MGGLDAGAGCYHEKGAESLGTWTQIPICRRDASPSLCLGSGICRFNIGLPGWTAVSSYDGRQETNDHAIAGRERFKDLRISDKHGSSSRLDSVATQTLQFDR